MAIELARPIRWHAHRALPCGWLHPQSGSRCISDCARATPAHEQPAPSTEPRRAAEWPKFVILRLPGPDTSLALRPRPRTHLGRPDRRLSLCLALSTPRGRFPGPRGQKGPASSSRQPRRRPGVNRHHVTTPQKSIEFYGSSALALCTIRQRLPTGLGTLFGPCHEFIASAQSRFSR